MVVNKKGQNLTIGTIIMIVLGIAVLVFLIFGFSTGWNNMWSKITNLGGGEANVATIRQSCVLACSIENKEGFCDQVRIVKYYDPATPGKIATNEEGTCDDWTSEDGVYSNMGVPKCPAITCE
jgi:hypothetical protein